MPGPGPSEETKKKYDVYSGAKKATGIGPGVPERGIFTADKPGGGALNQIVDFVRGVLGSDTGQKGPDANAWGQLLAAGIPFLGKGFHATPASFKEFDPSLYNKGDVLGSMTHFSIPSKAGLEETAAENAARFVSDYRGSNKGLNVIPAKLQLQNVLDLTSKLPDEDIAILSHHMDDESRASFADSLKNGWPQHWLEHHLTQNPTLLTQSGFDGVKYRDTGGGELSMAVPSSKRVETPWGLHLQGPKELGELDPRFAPIGGEQQVNLNRPQSTAITDPREAVYQSMMQKLPTNPTLIGK